MPSCPICGSPAVPILYGLPTEEAVWAAERGEVVLGGCMPGGDNWACTAHEEHSWRDTPEPEEPIRTEAQVVAAFKRWLERQGWSVRFKVDHIDIVAVRDNCTLICEAKGITSEPGLDNDTMFGQLLRRMTDERLDDPNLEFAVVVPSKSVPSVMRVPQRVRQALRIAVFGVTEDGEVTLH